ncbi:STAS domain-containing protein [Solihabitans fulvus]|uniref:STAS domain-containing protein n=1 Tax=Solihabitans fulvus TaxID=1892852 RepID=UPI001661D20D
MDLELNSVTVAGGVTIVEANGELDVLTAPRMREYMINLINDGRVRLIIDLDGLDFLDSTGLGVLVGVFKRIRSRHGELALVCSQERLLKIFRITGLTKVFAIAPNLTTGLGLVSGSIEPPESGEVGWHWPPARIYLDDAADNAAVQDALGEVVHAFGMDIVFAFPAVEGSWFREFLVRLRRSGTLPTMEDQLAKLTRALELQVLHAPQAKIDAAQGEAVSKLVTSLGGQQRALIQIGSLLLVKIGDDLFVRNLSQLELAHWERNPALFRDPAAALLELQKAADATAANAIAAPGSGAGQQESPTQY